MPGDEVANELEAKPVPYKIAHPLEVEPALLNAPTYDVLPTMAFMINTPVNALAASYGMRYLFMGSEDGFIRQFDFRDTVNGKQLLTSGQRHQVADTVTKGGVIVQYWENEQPQYDYPDEPQYLPVISPVHSLAAHSEALWLCAGLESGGISLQNVRCGPDVGQILAYLDGHTGPVSDMQLQSDEKHLLSASWDRSVRLWDLNTGQEAARWSNLSSQLSTVAWQPLGAPLPEGADDDESVGSLFGDEEEEQTPHQANDGNVFLSATFNGCLELWDSRQQNRVMLLGQRKPSQAPPWCMSCCWGYDGVSVYAGRRNSTVEEYDIRNSGGTTKVLKFPSISGPVSSVLALPNRRGLLCGSRDNVRLWDLGSEHKIPFYIIPGHHGTVVSRMILDETGRFLVTATGGRGWQPATSEFALGYEIGPEGARDEDADAD